MIQHQVSHWSISAAVDSNCPTWSGASRPPISRPAESCTAMKSTCGSATPQSSSVFMNPGSSFFAICSGMSPIEPLTSSAKTMPIEFG